MSPIFPPSPHPLSHDAEQDPGSITDSHHLPPSFLAAAHHTSEYDLTQTDHVEHHFAQADHSDHQLTKVEHQLTQEDHSDQKPTQEHDNTLFSERPASNSLVYEQEAPVNECSAVEKDNEGSCVLGKRKSSERDSHSSDDGYCTCGSSCDSTPSGSTAMVAPAMNCICHNKVKRTEYRATEHQPSSEDSSDNTNVSDGRQEELGHMGTEVCKPAADGSNEDVNEILDDFDRIFESPEAIAALQQKERPSTPTPTPAIDYHQAEQLRSCATPQQPRLVEAKSVPLVADSTVSGSTGEVKVPDIELEIDIAKREDEDLKKAMEESLKQQVIGAVESLQCHMCPVLKCPCA